MAKGTTGIKIITPRARLSFPSLLTPETQGQFAKGEYKAQLLFDVKEEADGIKAMKRAILSVAQTAFGKETKLKDIQHPFRDGNEKTQPGYAGTLYINPKSKYRPGVVDAKMKEITNEGDIYPGCYVRASVIPYSYVSAGKKGVSFRLCNVQKIADGEPMAGGTSNPNDDFGPADGGGDDVPFDEGDDLGL